jgi:hypothetical protein
MSKCLCKLGPMTQRIHLHLYPWGETDMQVTTCSTSGRVLCRDPRPCFLWFWGTGTTHHGFKARNPEFSWLPEPFSPHYHHHAGPSQHPLFSAITCPLAHFGKHHYKELQLKCRTWIPLIFSSGVGERRRLLLSNLKAFLGKVNDLFLWNLTGDQSHHSCRLPRAVCEDASLLAGDGG